MYINGGELYKAPAPSELEMNYVPDPNADTIFPFTKADGKQYLFTEEFKAFFGNNKASEVNLSDLALCPAVNLWICLGANSAQERNNYDLFFAAESTEQLRQVADYYSLPYPIADGLGEKLNSEPETLCIGTAGDLPVVPGCIKIIDGKPSIFKLYTFPKARGSWDVYMYGAVYFEGGKCYEKGAVYEKTTGGKDLDEPWVQMRGKASFRKAEIIESERFDGVRTCYSYTTDGDPSMFWQGNEVDGNGELLRVKRYESSRMVQIALASMKRGPDLLDRNLCPAVQFWLGRSWYDNASEGSEELLFAVTDGSAMLEKVADYYGLPVPHNAEQGHILDTYPELYRVRHYDFLGLGIGQYINIVAAGVVFNNGQPVKLLLYTFMRPWEFEELIILPDF